MDRHTVRQKKKKTIYLKKLCPDGIRRNCNSIIPNVIGNCVKGWNYSLLGGNK